MRLRMLVMRQVMEFASDAYTILNASYEPLHAYEIFHAILRYPYSRDPELTCIRSVLGMNFCICYHYLLPY